MRFKKTIFLSIILLVIFLIYTMFNKNNINYVVLGDSLAAGENSYGELGYGYSDYIKKYLQDNNKLKSYIRDYAVSGYKVEDILDDIKLNKKLTVDKQVHNIREALRESNLVTISIGANDFLSELDIRSLDLNNTSLFLEKIDSVIGEIDELLKEIKKYAKENIIIIGYYNPFPVLFNQYGENIDQVFRYADISYKKLASKHDVYYVPIYELFKKNENFLPNPFNIHPNIDGYQAISNEVISSVLTKLD